MTDDELARRFSALAEALEKQADVMAAVIATTTTLMGRDLELQDGIADLTSRLTFVARRNALLVNMKAVTLTQKCARCGCEYAQEPGPELCGPCWTELGRPERYLTTAGA